MPGRRTLPLETLQGVAVSQTAALQARRRVRGRRRQYQQTDIKCFPTRSNLSLKHVICC